MVRRRTIIKRRRPNTDKKIVKAFSVFKRAATGAGIAGRKIKSKTERTRENIKRRGKNRFEVIKY